MTALALPARVATPSLRGSSTRLIRACVDYYADFKDEVDREMVEEAAVAARERKRARRRRDVLGEAAAR